MTNIPAPVPKPNPAGVPRSAVVVTRMAFANIRTGPSTRYRPAGDLRNHTLVLFYPDTRTSDGWVWVEQIGLAGWVSTSVVTFEEVANAPEGAQRRTPFDHQIGVWHERSESVPHETIDSFAANLKRAAPNITQVYLKTCDWTPQAGAQWMGYWDTRREMAVTSSGLIDTWARTLAEYDLALCVWATPRGGDAQAEADIAAESVRQGVQALILDLQPWRAAWAGDPDWIERYLEALRAQIDSACHVGISFDAARTPPDSLWLSRWRAAAASIHPRVLWSDARLVPAAALSRAWNALGTTPLPIIPVLQGSADPLEMREAQTLAAYRHGARGISWWRTGTIHAGGWHAIRQYSLKLTDSTPAAMIAIADDIVTKSSDADCTIQSQPETVTMSAAHSWGWKYLALPVASTSAADLWVTWTPKLATSGLYEIAAFIPHRHASAQAVRYTVRTAAGWVHTTVDQAAFRSQWVTLAVAPLDPAQPLAGEVRLSNLGDGAGAVAVDAVRWRRIHEGAPVYVSDGYDMPAGTATERKSRRVWGGEWLDASPFGKLYFVGTHDEAYHTGTDLNLPQNADAHTPVYSTANGVVTFAGRLPVWGNVIVVRHDPLITDGLVLYGRYAHVENMRVNIGERVQRGQHIADVGDGFGRWAYLLHFDLSPTAVLATQPGHWPKNDREQLFKHYLDPREFIENNRPV
ncbi:MAG: peptidoglycan DD-metalloendopeptidase family protein [bacterium]|nr:peptidoglycan DD-metalloendopeptidase family protein [bacterium]